MVVEQPIDYTIITTNDRLHNITELVAFLKQHENTDIVLEVNPEAHSLESCGFYNLLDQFNFSNVTILTYNALETHSKYSIVHRPIGGFLHKSQIDVFDRPEYHQWSGKYRFGVFYGRPSANRIGIASHLFTNHRDQSHIVFAKNPKDEDNRNFFEIDKLFAYDKSSLSAVSNFVENFDFVDYDYTPYGHKYNKNNPMHKIYQHILIDIISEPNILGDSFFPTEKFSRAVAMKRPFIVMAGDGYCEYLRQMGFETFWQFWDENYDGYSAKDRYSMIIELINSLASLSDSDFLELYKSMESVIEHNYQILVNQEYKTEITKLS